MPSLKRSQNGWGLYIEPTYLGVFADYVELTRFTKTGHLRVIGTGQLQLGTPHVTFEANGTANTAGSGFILKDSQGNKLFDCIQGGVAQSGAFGGEMRIWQNRNGSNPNPLLDLYNKGAYGEIVIRFAHANADDTLISGAQWVLGVLPDPAASGQHRHFQFNLDGNYSAWLVDENLRVVIGPLTNPQGSPASLTHQHGAARLEIRGYTDEIQLLAKGHSTQTANILEVQNSAGTVRLAVSATGIGFFAQTPATQQTHIVDADGTLADITTKFNNLLLKIETYGLLASS